MTIRKNIPENPMYRERVFVVDDELHEKMVADKDAKEFLLADDVLVLYAPALERQAEEFPAIRRARNEGILIAGNCLVIDQSSGEERYSLLESFVGSGPEAKARNVITVCQLLGAKSCEFALDQCEESIASGEVCVDASIERIGAEGGIGGGASKRRSAKDVSKIFANAKFDGGEANIAKAEIFIRERGLDRDDCIRGLLDYAKNLENRINKYDLMIDVAREVRSKADFFVKAKANVKGFMKGEISVRGNNDFSSIESMVFNLKIIFR